MRARIVVAAWLVSTGVASADCDHFKWSLAREKAWFAQPTPAEAEIAPLLREVFFPQEGHKGAWKALYGK